MFRCRIGSFSSKVILIENSVEDMIAALFAN